jgi:PAS domain S-box-containing protein
MENAIVKMEKFNRAVLNETATWWQMELPSGAVIFGVAKAKMLGYPDTMFNKYQDFVDLVHPDDREKAMQSMRDHLAGKAEIYEAVYRIKPKDGDYIKFYDCGRITKKEGENIKVMGFVMKISEGVELENQMKEFKEMVVEGEQAVIDEISRIR